MVSSQLNSRLGFINPGLTSMGFEKGLLGSQYLFSAISISQWPLWWRCLNESEGVLDRFFLNRNLGLNGGFVWFSFFEIAIDFSGRSVNEWFPPWKQPLNESGRGFFCGKCRGLGTHLGFSRVPMAWIGEFIGTRGSLRPLCTAAWSQDVSRVALVAEVTTDHEVKSSHRGNYSYYSSEGAG